MKKTYEYMKMTFIFMCVLFTAMTILCSVISLFSAGSANAVFDTIGVLRIAGVAFVTSLLRSTMLAVEKSSRGRLSFVAVRLIFFPLFLAETMLFMLPVMGISAAAVMFIAGIFTVTFIVTGSIALPLHNARKKRYTQRMNEYLETETNDNDDKSE